MPTRRDFLGALAAAAASGLPSPASAARLGKIGIQLYTVRKDLEKDFDGTLAQVAGVGFTEVEIFDLYGRAPKDIGAALARHGLAAPSMHVGLPQIEKDFGRTLDAAGELRLRWVVCGWLDPNERKSLDDYRRHFETFDRAGEEAKKRGIEFGFHNHDFEFFPLEGAVPYDLLLEKTDPGLVQMEMDLYWITKGGRDPLEYFRKYPGRFPLVHVKDMDRTPEKGFTEVGKGIVEFRRVFAQAELGGIRHYYYEQDETPGPAIESARQSYEYLRKLEF
jgi:sugar phosphate isomerase/epimerase